MCLEMSLRAPYLRSETSLSGSEWFYIRKVEKRLYGRFCGSYAYSQQ